MSSGESSHSESIEFSDYTLQKSSTVANSDYVTVQFGNSDEQNQFLDESDRVSEYQTINLHQFMNQGKLHSWSTYLQ